MLNSHLAGIKALLDVLILKGCIVTMDALGGQKEIAEKIVDQGGDHVLQVKDTRDKLGPPLARRADNEANQAW